MIYSLFVVNIGLNADDPCIFELGVASAVECICLIDLDSGSPTLFSLVLHCCTLVKVYSMKMLNLNFISTTIFGPDRLRGRAYITCV